MRALCSRRCWQECRNQHARSRWKPSKLPTPLYKSRSKILIPKKFNPGSVTRLPPRQPTERGLHSQLCTQPEGKMPSGEQAPQEGWGPRCFHTKDPLKKDRRARHGGRITRHAERRCKTSHFSMSHQWKDQIRRPMGGLGRSRLRIPATAGRMLRVQPLHCPALSFPRGNAALGSRWSGFHGIPKRRGPRDAGMHPVVFVPQCGVFPTPFPQPLTFPMETKRVPFPGASGLLHSSAAVPCTSVVPQTLRD